MDTRVYSEKMINDLKRYLNMDNKFITYPKFVFLCGKGFTEDTYNSTNRGIIEKYIKAKQDNIYSVLSERLWEDNFNSSIDLLTFEEFLAELSDLIILFSESPGSFCELGVFAYAEKMFGEKLVVVLDKNYKGDNSFIMTGPVAKAQKDGVNVVYASLDGTGLLAAQELRSVVDNKIQELASKTATINKRSVNKEDKSVNLSSFIIELLELIKILQPISKHDLLDVYKKIKGFTSFSFVKKDNKNFHNEIKYDYIIKLLDTVNLIRINSKGEIESDKCSDFQSLMFRQSTLLGSKERNKVLCKRYRYGRY